MMLALVAVLAAPAAAQELSVGYQVQRFSSNGDSSTVPLGVSASLAGPASGPVGVVGQVDWSRKRESESVRPGYDATFLTFAGGARWSGRTNPSATPFVEALFGAMRMSTRLHSAGQTFNFGSATHAMLQLGGGVSMPAGRALGAFGQLDYRRIFADIGVNDLRFVAGARLTIR